MLIKDWIRIRYYKTILWFKKTFGFYTAPQIAEGAPVTLAEHAVIAIDLAEKDFGKRASSAFRKVFPFSVDGEHFVVKVDREKDYDGNHGCRYEAEFWNIHKNGPLGKLLAPVLTHGVHNGQHFTVQPRLRTLADIREEKKDQYWYGDFHDSAMNYAYSVYPDYSEHVGDLHAGNWGVNDDDGHYFIIDYSY